MIFKIKKNENAAGNRSIFFEMIIFLPILIKLLTVMWFCFQLATYM